MVCYNQITEDEEMEKVILEGKGLCKTFISGKTISHVIRNLDIDIYEGDFTVIMGASGAGKSTLLYALSGVDSITSGEINFNNKRIDQYKENQMTDIRRDEIGFVFQEPNLLDDFTVFENVALTGYLKTKNRKLVNSKTLSLLESVEMEEHHHKFPSQLSGGQKQRVAIARSLINEPKIIFADEPTGALNATQGELALEMLTDFNGKGQSILVVTHDIKVAARASRLLYMKSGKIDGILELNQFNLADTKEREQEVFDFIMSKGW